MKNNPEMSHLAEVSYKEDVTRYAEWLNEVSDMTDGNLPPTIRTEDVAIDVQGFSRGSDLLRFFRQDVMDYVSDKMKPKGLVTNPTMLKMIDEHHKEKNSKKR